MAFQLFASSSPDLAAEREALGQAVAERLRLGDLGEHVGELGLGDLERSDGAVELNPCL